ncbi:MAG: capsid protein [Chaetfec virus UA24_8279]|nr:MAG: capsid protein [Chaetfec virus UA24_8279]
MTRAVRRRRRHAHRRRFAHRRRRRTFRRRYRSFHKFKYGHFHVRLQKTLTTLWPKATNPTNKDDPALGWNTDHLQFTLVDFLPPKWATAVPFKYYRIRKIVVRGRPINVETGTRTITYGNTALDLDGLDVPNGKIMQARDPKKLMDGPMGIHENDAPSALTYDPLKNRTSARHYSAARGFKRVWRPTPQTQIQLVKLQGSSVTWQSSDPVASRGLANSWWDTVQSGKLPWEGLFISMRESDSDILLEYDIHLYVEFKEFNLLVNPVEKGTLQMEYLPPGPNPLLAKPTATVAPFNPHWDKPLQLSQEDLDMLNAMEIGSASTPP